jgi:hypothetical protein
MLSTLYCLVTDKASQNKSQKSPTQGPEIVEKDRLTVREEYIVAI